MHIHFEEIPPEGLRIELREEAWFPDHEVARCAEVHASVFLQKKGERVLLDGSMDTVVRLQCDRCLEAYQQRLAPQFRVEFELVGQAGASGPVSDHLCGAAEMDMIYLEEPVIDLFQILQQQVFLALPMKNLCAEHCRGLCVECGANLNVAPCNCRPRQPDSPFSVLARLKK